MERDGDVTPPAIPDIPKADGSDLVYKVGLAVLSLIPLPITPVVEMMIRSPTDKRNDNWRSEMTLAVKYLGERLSEVEFSALKQDEEFATTLLRATRAAMSTHRKEKHEMLRNAVLHSALPNAPEDDERTVFLNLVDEFSVAHILILKTFSQPVVSDGLGFSLEDSDWKSNMGVGFLFDFVQNVTPETELDYNFFILVLSDLHNRDLISNTHQERHVLARFSHWPELTTFGGKFLNFIESPLDD